MYRSSVLNSPEFAFPSGCSSDVAQAMRGIPTVTAQTKKTIKQQIPTILNQRPHRHSDFSTMVHVLNTYQPTASGTR
jgi:hypothetical protein